MLFYLIAVFFQLQDASVQVFYKNRPVTNAKIYSQKNILLSNTDLNGMSKLSLTRLNFPITIKTNGFSTVSIEHSQFKNQMVIYLEKNVFQSDEVSVTAIKTKISEGEEFTAIQIKNIVSVPKASGNMKYRFAETPEILMQESSANGGSPIYKGFRANKLLFTVNGIRFNNALFKSGNTPYISLLNPVYFDNTSISDGANSILFGSDAIGGAINYSSEKVLKDGFTLSVSNGFHSANNMVFTGFKSNYNTINTSHSFGMYYGEANNLNYGSKNNETLDFYFNYDDKTLVPYTQKQAAGFKQLNVDYDGKFNLTNTTIGWGYHSGKQYDADDFFRLTQKGSYSFKYEPIRWRMEYLSFETAFNESTKLISKLYHQYFQEYKHEFKTETKERIYDDAINVFGLNTSLYQTISDKLNLSYGVDAIWEKSDTNSNSTAKYPNDAKQFQFGLFASTKYIINDTYNVSSGVRYSYQNSQIPFLENIDPVLTEITAYEESFNSFIFSIGIEQIKQNWRSSLTLNNAFRAPNFDDLGKFGENKNGSLHLPNTTLSPEKSLNISWKNSFHFKNFYVNSDIFGSYLTDLIEETSAFINQKDTITLSTGDLVNLKQNSNLSNAVIYGTSLSIDYILSELSFKNSFSYVFGEQTNSNEPLSKIPPFRNVFKINYKLSENASIYFIDTYSAEQTRLSNKDITSDDRISPNGTPSYNKIDLGLNYTFNTFIVGLELENILDERYRNHASALNGAGRSVYVSMNLNL